MPFQEDFKMLIHCIKYTAENFLSHLATCSSCSSSCSPNQVRLHLSQRYISMSPSIPWGKAFSRYSFRLIFRFEMKKDSLMSFCMLSKYLGTRLCSFSLTSHWTCPLSTLYPGGLEAEPNGGCSLERCGTTEGLRSSIRWVKGLFSHISVLVLSFPNILDPW